MICGTSELWLDSPGSHHDLVLELDEDVFVGPTLTPQRLHVDVGTARIVEVIVGSCGVFGFSFLTLCFPVRHVGIPLCERDYDLGM